MSRPKFRLKGMTAKEDTVMKKVAVVTGVSGRIGRGIARRLEQDGFVVVVNYLHDAADVSGLVAEIIRMGGDAIAIKADVANQFWVRSFFDEIAKELGRIDVVVSNAEIPPLRYVNSRATSEDAIAANLRGTFLVLTQASLFVADGGRIIVVSSSAQARSHPACTPHLASEARVEAYLYRLANELRERNISVNVIACGSDRAEFSLQNKTEEQAIYVDRFPTQEHPEYLADIAGVVSFLAGPDGGLVTSQVLCANGSAA